MDFIKYLQFAKNSSKKIDCCKKVHIVIGNESCDMDSTVSSLAYAYFLDKHRIPIIEDHTLVIPVINASYEDFLLRTETLLVLEECGIGLGLLIFRDQLDIKELLKTSTVTITLVDHHVLPKDDKALENAVIQIFDHRPTDPGCNWNCKRVKLTTKEVGSCSTLIAEEIFEVDEMFFTRDLAYLLYETIIYDTVGLLPEYGRATELDLLIAKKLENKFSFKEDRNAIYKRLWAAHIDVFHLTPKQILSRDVKIVENIPVPAVPMLVENFLKLDDAYEAIEEFAEEYNAPLLVIVGLDASTEVKRDLAIFWTDYGIHMTDLILDKLKNSMDLKGYDFCFTKMFTEYKNIIYLKQNNVMLSRKQIIPLIKDSICCSSSSE